MFQGFLRKARAFLRLWVTPIQPLQPGVRYPIKNSYSVLGTIGLLALIVWYFEVASYESIPGKPFFWLFFVAWAAPPTILGWAYRNKSSRRELNAFGKLMIAISIVGLVLATWGRLLDPLLLPIVYAAIPGVMAGCLVGADSVWLWGILKHRRHPKKSGTTSGISSEPRKLETTDEDTHLDQY